MQAGLGEVQRQRGARKHHQGPILCCERLGLTECCVPSSTSTKAHGLGHGTPGIAIGEATRGCAGAKPGRRAGIAVADLDGEQRLLGCCGSTRQRTQPRGGHDVAGTPGVAGGDKSFSNDRNAGAGGEKHRRLQSAWEPDVAVANSPGAHTTSDRACAAAVNVSAHMSECIAPTWGVRVRGDV